MMVDVTDGDCGSFWSPCNCPNSYMKSGCHNNCKQRLISWVDGGCNGNSGSFYGEYTASNCHGGRVNHPALSCK